MIGHEQQMQASPECGNASEVVAPGRALVGLDVTESRTRNFLRELERRGFQVYEFSTIDGKHPLVNFASFVRAVLRSEFVLCGSAERNQIPLMLLVRLLRRRCIIDFPMDVVEWPFPTVWHRRLSVGLALHLANYVVTLRSRAYLVEKFGLKKGRVLFIESCPERAQIESSMGAPRFRAKADSLLICCSGCHPHHRLERFVPIFEELLALLPNVELLVIGDPSQPSIVRIRQYAAVRGFAHRVHVLPVIKPVEDFYATVRQCDLWVATLGDDTLQGQQELRMELLEVALLGKPVAAASTVGIVRSGFADDWHIAFIDASDPAGSAIKIANLLQSPAKLAAMANRLRQYVIERFSLTDAVHKLLNAAAGPR